jgi:5-methylcytosine-specific restriction endonuclease McrA
VAIRYRRYAAANKGRIADYKRRWRQENPNALRDWHARNPSKAPQYKKAEYERDADKIKARVKRHRKDNPEMYAAVSRNKRARKRSAGGTHSADDIASIRKMQRDRCANCQTKLDGGGHVDHIFPLAKGGSNDRRNLQLLCARCNTTKHAKDPLTFARENGRLL